MGIGCWAEAGSAARSRASCSSRRRSAKDDFLSPDRAYRYTTRVEGDRLIVAWDIEPGYYLYKKKMGVVSTTADAQLGEPQWPKGEDHTDEYFGTQEIYRGKVEVPVPIVISWHPATAAQRRAPAAGLRGRGPVLSAAEVEDRGQAACDCRRRRHRQQAKRRARARCSARNPGRPARTTSCRPTKRFASAPGCRRPTRSRSPG